MNSSRPQPRGRVLLVAPQPFFRVTGTPINVLLMCRALCEGGYQVDLLTLPDGDPVAIDGLTIRRVPRILGLGEVPVGFSAGKVLYDVLVMLWTFGLLCRCRYDVVHGIEEAAFFSAPLGRLFGAAAITDLDSDLPQQLAEHCSPMSCALARPARWLRRFALRMSSAVISVARHMSDISRSESPGTAVFEIRDIPMEEAVRLPDPARTEELRTALALPGRRLIVYTGNFDRRQGLQELADALPEVLAVHPDVTLVVIGGQREAIAQLQARIDSLGLGNAVRLLGPQPPDTMPEYMSMADLLVSPRLEPYATPLKIFSYMASGRPIVATDLPTHTDVLDETTAFLTPPTPEGLARGLIRALSAPAAAVRRGRNARTRAAERHTFEAFRQQLLAAYAHAIGRRRGALPHAADQESLVHG